MSAKHVLLEGDALDRELASLKQTISLCNPIFQGHANDWYDDRLDATRDDDDDLSCRKSTAQVNQDLVQREKKLFAEPAKPFNAPKKKKHIELDRAVATTPLAKDKEIASLLQEINSGGGATPPAAVKNNNDEVAYLEKKEKPPAVPKPIPKAKQMHMDGILHGLPVASNYKLTTTTAEHFEYDGEMKTMNREKDVSHFRKRDTYSEYVEARARFSKMHSVT
ncbi:Aste57867_20116 [Aphanomyces stellatus]|uniref:Aste57867_20116 protein n=1 Tax=Aphanomyces stellatus TaxID=120398 RepID=A0A485LFF4_9STRA|nr:hypothetical protein As57867_020050 [Aphanomyces stellatus]VFT96811.1 Aste57867_20116 [Aphanomyces stellatus]